MGDSGALAGMSDEEIYDKPSDVSAEEGVVSVKGPDSVSVQLTPEAADETSERLFRGALKARGQKVSENAARNRKPFETGK
jgi:hypothetical protein